MWHHHVSRIERLLLGSVTLALLVYIKTYLPYLTVSGRTRTASTRHGVSRWEQGAYRAQLNPGRAFINSEDEDFKAFMSITGSLKSRKSNPKMESQTLNASINNTARFIPRVLTHAPRKCRIAPWEQPEVPYTLTSDTNVYFSTSGTWRCFREGTRNNNGSHCHCHDSWHGNHCSIPDIVWYSDLGISWNKTLSHIEPRFDNYRGIIQAFPFNIEFDQLDARLAEIGDIVDVFLILESNYTAFGEPKPLYLLDKLKQGYYNRSSCKIVHVFLNYFPERAKVEGWVADRLHRDFLSTQGLVRQLTGYHQDDLFVLTDSDEIPSRESLLFLKLHNGYPEPVGIRYEASIYGFFWHNPVPLQRLPSVVTIGILTHVLHSRAYSVRNGVKDILKHKSELNQYLKSHGSRISIRLWYVGNLTHPAGWHCSWCLSAEGIQNKLLSAQNGDFPRWGNYPSKSKLDYIEGLVATGTWFDNNTKFNKRANISTLAVPKYFLDNSNVYKYLLFNLYEQRKTTEKQSRLARILAGSA